MNQTVAVLLGMIPALLIILGAFLIRRAGPAERVPHRTLLLFEITALSILGLLFGLQLLPAEIRQRLYWVSTLFVPSIFGLVILVLMNLPHIRNFNRQEKISLILPALAIAAIVTYYLSGPYMIMEIVPSAAVILLAAWLINRRPAAWIWAPVALVCALWVWVNGPAAGRVNVLPPLLSTLMGITWMLLPVLSVALAAVLLVSGLDLGLATAFTPGIKNYRAARIEGGLRLIAMIILLFLLAYSTYWASVWDQTTDGLGGLFFSFYASFAAIACGLVMALRASGLRKLAGAAFLILVPLLVNTAFTMGWGVKFPQLTEKRAAQVAAALERYHARENRYPENLSQLVPRDLFVLPQPVMFQGESWCYQATPQAFRLAAFYHQYFGLPVSLNVYASAGNLENQPLPCQERLADMQARFDWTHLPLGDSITQ